MSEDGKDMTRQCISLKTSANFAGKYIKGENRGVIEFLASPLIQMTIM